MGAAESLGSRLAEGPRCITSWPVGVRCSPSWKLASLREPSANLAKHGSLGRVIYGLTLPLAVLEFVVPGVYLLGIWSRKAPRGNLVPQSPPGPGEEIGRAHV